MVEQEKNQISVEELLASMVNIETPGNEGLAVTLQKIGYEITTDTRRDGKVIWIHASYETTIPRHAPSVALIFSKDGVIHAPKYDQSFDTDENIPKAKLVNVAVPPYENKIEFSFEGVENPEDKRIITLVTNHTREKSGDIFSE